MSDCIHRDPAAGLPGRRAPLWFAGAVIAALLSLALSGTAGAQAAGEGLPSLLRFELTAEDWVVTETAEVEIQGALTLLEADRATARRMVRDNLFGMVPDTRWRITEFTRSTDESGAEKWTFRATARLSQSAIDGLRDKLDALTRPGHSYRLGRISMAPSLAEYETARADLRTRIYGMARAELAGARILWPDRDVGVRRVDFVSDGMIPPPEPRPSMLAVESRSGRSAPVTVERKITLSAIVLLGPIPPAGE